nr:hypothetical protein [Palleronia rufa]
MSLAMSGAPLPVSISTGFGVLPAANRRSTASGIMSRMSDAGIHHGPPKDDLAVERIHDEGAADDIAVPAGDLEPVRPPADARAHRDRFARLGGFRPLCGSAGRLDAMNACGARAQRLRSGAASGRSVRWRNHRHRRRYPQVGCAAIGGTASRVAMAPTRLCASLRIMRIGAGNTEAPGDAHRERSFGRCAARARHVGFPERDVPSAFSGLSTSRVFRPGRRADPRMRSAPAGRRGCLWRHRLRTGPGPLPPDAADDTAGRAPNRCDATTGMLAASSRASSTTRRVPDDVPR